MNPHLPHQLIHDNKARVFSRRGKVDRIALVNLELLNVIGGVEAHHIQRLLHWPEHVEDLSQCALSLFQEEHRVQVYGWDVGKGLDHHYGWGREGGNQSRALVNVIKSV